MEAGLFLAGLFVGTTVGFLMAGALAAGAEDDRRVEEALRREHEDYQRAGDELRTRRHRDPRIQA